MAVGVDVRKLGDAAPRFVSVDVAKVAASRGSDTSKSL
jgi:hypothetical protein